MKRREAQQLIIFLILGAGLLLWAYFVTPHEKVKEFPSTALISAAFVLLAVSLLNFVYWLAGGEPISQRLERLTRELTGSFEILKDAEETGLERLLGTSRDFERKGGSWMGKLAAAKRNVDLMGYSLLVWSTGRNFHSEMLDLLRRNVHVRVLIMDPENTNFDALVNFHQIPSVKDVEAVKAEVRRAVAVFEEIARKAPSGDGVGTFQFRKIRTGLCFAKFAGSTSGWQQFHTFTLLSRRRAHCCKFVARHPSCSAGIHVSSKVFGI